MRYFLRPRRAPQVRKILLVESGSRHLLERLIPNLRNVHGEDVSFDLFTCFPGQPNGLGADSQIYRTGDFPPDARRALYRRLRGNDYQAMGVVCSAESIMTKWKWMLVRQVPAHVFLINENADYVWLDRAHASGLLVYSRTRLGLEGAGAVRSVARIVLFPFTLLFLLLYASAVHTRRAIRQITS